MAPAHQGDYAAVPGGDADDAASLDGSEHGEGQRAPLTSGSSGAEDAAGAPGHGSGRRSGAESAKSSKAQKVPVAKWSELPRKKQLAVITLSRLSEPLVQTSLQSYMFYMLKWFDPKLPDSVIAGQAGLLHASFTAAQFLTAMVWGRVADSERAGRKMVIMIGLLGTLISCLGFGFSTSFYQALFFRCLGGVTNGNVGVMRTMISEIVREKKYQSKAFLLLPMTFNIGIIIGPVLGGLLSDPAGSYPGIFGKVDLFVRFPYALPNLVSAAFLTCALVGIWLFLEETHDSLRDTPDYGRTIAKKIGSFFGKEKDIRYTLLHSRNTSVSTDIDLTPGAARDEAPTPRRGSVPSSGPRFTQRLPFGRIFTRNVVFTFVSYFLMALHLGTFNALWFVFLSTPVYDASHPDPAGFVPSPPLRFTGGLGMRPSTVGTAMALLGAFGITMQLLLYPRLAGRFGTVATLRVCLCLFPLAYVLLPYLALVPSSTAPPGPKTGVGVWAAMAGVLLLQTAGRTFALPAHTILVNNCTPHPSVLGTVHGMAQSVSSFARTLGPVTGGWLYGLGLSHGMVGGVFWIMAAAAVCGLGASFLVREGDGHEIWLEGDNEEDR